MNFALNYSHPAAELIRANKIDVDLFKCPDWPNVIAAARELRPVYVHFPINAGSPSFAGVDWHKVESMAGNTNTPFINVHISPQLKDYPGLRDSSDESEVLRVRERVIGDVGAVVRRFGAERVMIEMVPYGNPAEGFFGPATCPDMICDVCRETGCGLLLDVSHCRITARVLGQDARAFVERMPVDRLRELHVTGLGWQETILKDHRPMTAEDWVEFDWMMGRIRSGAWARPWCVACEYGGVGPQMAKISDPEVIAEQVPRMCEAVRAS